MALLWFGVLVEGHGVEEGWWVGADSKVVEGWGWLTGMQKSMVWSEAMVAVRR